MVAWMNPTLAFIQQGLSRIGSGFVPSRLLQMQREVISIPFPFAACHVTARLVSEAPKERLSEESWLCQGGGSGENHIPLQFAEAKNIQFHEKSPTHGCLVPSPLNSLP